MNNKVIQKFAKTAYAVRLAFVLHAIIAAFQEVLYGFEGDFI